MKNLTLPFLLFFLLIQCGYVTGQVHMNTTFSTPYGDNGDVGKYILLNGAKIYYEEYGEGEPLLLIHGNGGSIKSMGNQIDFFKSKYRVIVADSRGQGKSELKTDSLTYLQIADDWEELVNYLALDSINIFGWSDGGIISLIMGINGKSKIKKMAAMGANLCPDSTAVYSWAVKNVIRERKIVESKLKEKDTTRNWFVQKQLLALLGDQPNIKVSNLSKIKAKVLIIAGDQDIIRGEHSLKIYENIPSAQLCIIPGETHYAPASNPVVFNAIINRFFTEPFKRPNSDWSEWE